MIHIDKMHHANLAMPMPDELVIYGKILTPFEEHQLCQKIVKMLLKAGISAEVSTDAKLNGR